MLLLPQSLAPVHALVPAKEGPEAPSVPCRTRGRAGSGWTPTPRLLWAHPARAAPGRMGTRMCLLSKATDAKPKHGVPRLQRLLQTSQAERQLKALCAYKVHTKLFFFFPSVHSRQFASCRRFCCHCYCSAFGSLDVGDGDVSSSQLGPAHPDLRAGGPHLVIQMCVCKWLCDLWSLVPFLTDICSLGYLSGKHRKGSVWPWAQ